MARKIEKLGERPNIPEGVEVPPVTTTADKIKAVDWMRSHQNESGLYTMQQLLDTIYADTGAYMRRRAMEAVRKLVPDFKIKSEVKKAKKKKKGGCQTGRGISSDMNKKFQVLAAALLEIRDALGHEFLDHEAVKCIADNESFRKLLESRKLQTVDNNKAGWGE